MDGYSLSENWIFLLGFTACFIGLLAIGAYIVEDIIPRHKRKIQKYFKNNVRWFR